MSDRETRQLERLYAASPTDDNRDRLSRARTRAGASPDSLLPGSFVWQIQLDLRTTSTEFLYPWSAVIPFDGLCLISVSVYFSGSGEFRLGINGGALASQAIFSRENTCLVMQNECYVDSGNTLNLAARASHDKHHGLSISKMVVEIRQCT